MKFPPFIFLSSKVAIFRFHRPILEAYVTREAYTCLYSLCPRLLLGCFGEKWSIQTHGHWKTIGQTPWICCGSVISIRPIAIRSCSQEGSTNH